LESEFINMKQTENLKNASDRLKEAQQLLLLAIEKGTISSIDRELILEKLRKAYDTILFENEVEKHVVTTSPVVQPVKVKIERVLDIPSKPNTPEVKPQVIRKITPETRNKDNKPIKVETAKTIEKTSIFDPSIKGLSEEKAEKIVEDQIELKPKERSILKTHQPESLAEKLQGKRKFVTDSLSNQIRSKPVASQLQSKPIDDLTKEIGVHDKFLFTKELFNGDNKLFEETLIRLNQYSDITEALIFIQENFNWNDNNKAASKFIELIRRKLLND